MIALLLLLAQSPPANYDESKVPPYTLPSALGEVTKAADWPARRAEILAMFEREMFGRSGPRPKGVKFELLETSGEALGGKAIRKQVRIDPGIEVLVYYPKQVSGPAPVFVGLNYTGNHGVTPDPGVRESTAWMRQKENPRGGQASRWSIERALERGYAVATAYYGDIDPDFDDGFQNGIHPLFYRPGQTKPAPDEWGSIGAWAWGLSRILDYLENDPNADAKRVIVHGHSRLGKAALWAGALDERFAMAISNNSGAGGAALSKRIYGETVKDLNDRFPHWFAQTFRKYNANEQALPFDQHMLIALIAPRPVYIASAQEDQWADPKGEFLSAVHADPVYRLLTGDGLPSKEMPEIHRPLMGRIGYHIRAGKHDVTDYDWQQWLDFADKHLKRR
jgi:hypothetical protein